MMFDCVDTAVWSRCRICDDSLDEEDEGRLNVLEFEDDEEEEEELSPELLPPKKPPNDMSNGSLKIQIMLDREIFKFRQEGKRYWLG